MEYSFTGCQNLRVTANDIPDLSSVESMYFMFFNCTALTGNTAFENWDVSNIRSMGNLFNKTSFNQNLENWNISRVWNMSQMFASSALSDENYAKMLMAWSELPQLQYGVYLGSNNNSICEALEAKSTLVENYQWYITDNGIAEDCVEEELISFKAYNLSFKSETDKITFWPNPSKGIVYYNSSGTNIKTIKVFDLLGRELKTFNKGNSQTSELDLKDLPNGNYLLLIINKDDSSNSKQLLINR